MNATIERLSSLARELACGEPGDCLDVRPSKQLGMRYEVYASGYPLNMHCQTAREAEQCIREHYRELRQQLAAGTATPINAIG